MSDQPDPSREQILALLEQTRARVMRGEVSVVVLAVLAVDGNLAIAAPGARDLIQVAGILSKCSVDVAIAMTQLPSPPPPQPMPPQPMPVAEPVPGDWQSRLVPNGRGGSRPATSPDDLGDTPLSPNGPH